MVVVDQCSLYVGGVVITLVGIFSPGVAHLPLARRNPIRASCRGFLGSNLGISHG